MGDLRNPEDRTLKRQPAEVQGKEKAEMVRDLGKDRSRASEAGVHRTLEGESPVHSAVPSVEGLSSKKRWMPKREDPELVTEAPAEDDPEVYGRRMAPGG